MIAIGMVRQTQEKHVSRGSTRPLSRGGAHAYPKLLRPLATPERFDLERSKLVTHMGRNVFFWINHASIPKEQVPRVSNFCDPLHMPKRPTATKFGTITCGQERVSGVWQAPRPKGWGSNIPKIFGTPYLRPNSLA